MAKLLTLSSTTLNSIICLLLLATTFATSARILDDITPDSPDPIAPPETDIPGAAPQSTTTIVAPIEGPTTPDEPAPPATATVPPIVDPTTPDEPASVTTPPPTTTPPATTTTTAPAATGTVPIATTTTGAATTATASGGAVPGDDHPTLSFFMHDILGGTRPSGRAVTGIAANTDAANAIPFSKPSNPIFPINGGVPLNTVNTAINNNNYPFLVGLNNGSPSSNTIIQSSGSNNQAFVTAGQLPGGLTLQQLMFGSITVVDNEITEGHELGTHVIGKAQGFYLTSSSDGSSHTVALTVIFHGSEHGDEIVDTVSFFGVHRTATPISHIAIIGGTGKYENAKGYATIETLPHVDQHLTDGLETITHFTLYLTP